MLLMMTRVLVKEPWAGLEVGPELFQLLRPVSILRFKGKHNNECREFYKISQVREKLR